MCRYWLHERSAGDIRHLQQGLAPLGLELEPGAGAAGDGLFIYSAWDPEIPRHVRELCRAGHRIIAVAAGGAPASGEQQRALLAAGAASVLAWREPEPSARRVRLFIERWAAVDAALAGASVQQQVVGSSPAWLDFLRQLAEAAMFSSAPILLLGESGTGKEQLSRLVHRLSRRGGQWVVVDCSAVEATLSGSEFFGHEKGAFTGAASQREGAFALAHQGTLFLDEVGELPPSLQAQLLRVTQEKTYKRLGSNRWFESDFRLVSATHRDLSADVEQERFRFDFLQRLGTWKFRVLPLRERPSDVLPLAEQFARRALGSSYAGIDPFLRDYLLRRRYPGNVRELEQVVTRASCRRLGEGPLSLADLAPADREGPALDEVFANESLDTEPARAVLSGLGLKEVLRRTRASAIRTALDASNHNVQHAAKLLRVTDRAVQMELAKRDERAADA